MSPSYSVKAGLKDAVELVSRSQRVAIFSHVNPDGDSVGVALGLYRGLLALGCEACVALSDPVPILYQYLADIEAVLADLPDHPFDLFFVADCGDIDRIGRLYTENRERFERTPVLNLDHHDSNTMFGTVNYVDVTAASSSELAYYLLQKLEVDIDPEIATDLLTGIVNDTASFQHSNTDSRVLQVAADLRARRGNLEQVAFEMFRAKPLSTARLWGAILSTLKQDPSRGIVWAYMTERMAEETEAASDESEGIVDYMSGIREARMAVFLKEREPGVIRASLRSRGVDVSQICRALGGGGHIRAAGCTIRGSLAAAEKCLTRAYDELC